MTRAEDSERSACKPDANAPKPFPNMQPMIACRNTSMAELAQTLQQFAAGYMDHPVVDATGLEGGWDFVMGWTAKNALQAPQESECESDPNQPAGAIAEAADPKHDHCFRGHGEGAWIEAGETKNDPFR